MNYTAEQIAAAIEADALAWADFYKVTNAAEIEARRNVMRANIAVGYMPESLVEFLPLNNGATEIEK